MIEFTTSEGRQQSHLAAFADGWSLWRWTCVRGAGFPIDLMNPLGAPECTPRALAAIDAAAEAGRSRDRLIAALAHAHREAAGDRRRHLSLVLRVARRRRVPTEPIEMPGATALVDQTRRADEARDRAWNELRAALRSARVRARRHLRDVGASDLFARAILWQNSPAFRRVVRQVVSRLPLEPVTGDERTSSHELLLVNYLQRYATKNDTIGFFGPKCWALIEPHSNGIDARYGGTLTRRSSVRFENWAIDRLANVLERDPALTRWLIPRRSPLISVHSDDVVTPFVAPSPLSEAAGAVLRAANGLRAAEDVAAALVGERNDLFKNSDDVYEVLAGLCRAGLVTLRFELPLTDEPEALLRQQLAGIGDASRRAACLRQLDALESGRAAAAAAVDATALDHALASLETAFQQVTGDEPHRVNADAPRGKRILYNDCIRDADVSVGKNLLGAAGEAVGLLLHSARWFTYAVAGAYAVEFDNVFARLARDQSQVPAAEFWDEARKVLFDDDRAPLVPVIEELRRRWREILPLPSDERCVTASSAAIKADVMRSFDAPHAGWRYARYVSLDVHVAARDRATIAEGRRTLVLGELHLGNALNANAFVAQHPSPADLWSAMEQDRLGRRVILLAPKSWRAATGRTAPPLEAPHDLRLVVDPDVHAGYDERTIPIGECTVERTTSGLHLRIPGPGASVPLTEAFATALTHIIFNEFTPFALNRHRPRLCVDEVVVLREAWQFSAQDLSFAKERDATRRFAAVQQWRRTEQLPRWCFVRLTGEGKPMHVDFDSPLLLELLLARLRRCVTQAHAIVRFTEMLPEPGDEWLQDGAGRRYTSELRIVAVDGTPVAS